MEAIDRDRLRAMATAAVELLSTMAEQAIATQVPQLLPPGLRSLVPLMADRLQIRSTMSAAATRVTDGLTDDELCALWALIRSHAEAMGFEYRGDALHAEEMIGKGIYYGGTTQGEVDRAVARLKQLLSE